MVEWLGLPRRWILKYIIFVFRTLIVLVLFGLIRMICLIFGSLFDTILQ
jgi:hypothetical protein